MKNFLRKKIDKIAKDLFGIEIDYSIEMPANSNFGDYSTNVAFLLGKKLKKEPNKIAENILEAIHKSSKQDFFKIEIAGGGFINFFLSEKVLIKELDRIIREKNKHGNNNLGKRSKVQLEFISANPTGPLTIGNGRGGFSGDALAKVLSKSGYEVQREYYVNDAGRQVRVILAKSIRRSLGLKIDVEEGEEIYGGDYIDRIAQKIRKEKGVKWIEKEYDRCGELAAKIILKDLIKKDIKDFGIKFDKFKSEKDFFKEKIIDKMWKRLKKDDLVYEKESAYWLKTSIFGDEKDRVIRTNQGEFTYLMSDIAYLYDRFKKRKFDKVIVIVGADHHGYIDRWKAAEEILGYKGRLEIIVTQLVRIVRGKKELRMSKRRGTFITLKEIIDEIGLDAARYFFISRDFNSHMDIDLDLAREESSKNPIYYIQYASARINSVFKKLKIRDKKLEVLDSLNFILDNCTLDDQFEIDLIKKLIQFPDIVEEIAKSYEVNKIANYTLDLASNFHKFYDNCRIMGDKKEKERIVIISAVKIVLENCLGIMGIEARKEM